MSRIHAVGTDLSLPAREGETILAALFRAGYAFKVGCRRGGCGICKVDLPSGQVDYPITVSDQVLTPQERSSGVALACRAVPRSDVVIAVPPESRLRCIAPLLTEIACQERNTSSPTVTVANASSAHGRPAVGHRPERRTQVREKE